MTYTPFRVVLTLVSCLTIMIPAGTYGPSYSPARTSRQGDALADRARAGDRPASQDDDVERIDARAPRVSSNL